MKGEGCLSDHTMSRVIIVEGERWMFSTLTMMGYHDILSDRQYNYYIINIILFLYNYYYYYFFFYNNLSIDLFYLLTKGGV